MKNRSVAPMRVAKIGYVTMSVILCAIGVLFIVLPEQSVEVLGMICGISMIVFGLIKIVGYLSKDLFRLAFQYDLEFGIILIVIGVIMLLHPESLVNFISISLGILILADGLFKIRIARDSKAFGIRQWWLIMILAIVSCACGFFLLVRPSDAAIFLSAVIGAALLCEGVLNLDVALSTVKIVKNQKPDFIDVDYFEEIN